MLRKIRMEIIGRIFKQRSIQSGKSGAWKTPFSPLKPPSSQGNSQGNSQEDKKGGAGGLIVGAGALFLLAKALL